MEYKHKKASFRGMYMKYECWCGFVTESEDELEARVIMQMHGKSVHGYASEN